MTVRIDDRGRARVEPKIVRGPVVAVSLVAFIAIFAVVAWGIHTRNRWAREQARQAAEAAEHAPSSL